MTLERTAGDLLPEAVAQVLEEFRRGFRLDLHLWAIREKDPPLHLFPVEGYFLGGAREGEPHSGSELLSVPLRNGTSLILEVRGSCDREGRNAANVLRSTLEHLYQYSEEIRFFTHEVSERYEEINLLYSISETLGSLLRLPDAARQVLSEVCDVVGARRGSLWVGEPTGERLELVASVGEHGMEGPLFLSDPLSFTARVFREGRPLILTSEGRTPLPSGGRAAILSPREESILSVPIRYTPPDGATRMVGVINLIGRRRGGRFTASDQKLLSAIASQVGAALENHRLIRESVERERVGREMELAHDLQMKLLPEPHHFDPERVGARVQPAEQVGGDFYQLFRLPAGRFGVMIGDVSSHGFPAALIMALSMSAGSIYVSEVESPGQVLTEMGQALKDELESTEMYLTLFYGVLDPASEELVYANAGHPHAFLIREDGSHQRLSAMDLPMGIGSGEAYGVGRVPWSPGKDLLLLFTDGLSDNLRSDSRRDGEEQVVAAAAGLRDRPAREIVDALFALEPGSGIQEGDDRTAVVVRI
jgi:phosphoserine phosphatase RsbU/P